MEDLIIPWLKTLEQEHSIKFLHVSALGSRGYGFAGLESDYDLKGVYVSTPDSYITARQKRKETIVGDLREDEYVTLVAVDASLFLRRARESHLLSLNTIQANNILETSPGADKLAGFTFRSASALPMAHSYRAALYKIQQMHVVDKSVLSIKRYLLAAHHALTLRHLRRYPAEIPPLKIRSLMISMQQEGTLCDLIRALIDRRQNGDEICFPVTEIDRLIRTEVEPSIEGFKAHHLVSFDETDKLLRELVK